MDRTGFQEAGELAVSGENGQTLTAMGESGVEGQSNFPQGYVPDANRAVVRRRNQTVVADESELRDNAGMAGHGVDQFAGDRVPEVDLKLST